MKYYGLHACEAIFRNRAADIVRVHVAEDRVRDVGPLLKWCAGARKAYHILSDADLEKVAASVHHEGICILAKEPPRLDGDTLLARLDARPGPVTLLYLDGVQNPHNVGSILRVAAHFGVPFLLGRDKQLPRLSPSACRVAEGGAEQVLLAALDRPEVTLAALRKRGFRLIATSSREGQSLYATTLPERAVLVVGAEVTGVSPKLLADADLVVSIPGTGAVESLNVSVASSLFLGEAWRQRGLG